MNIRVSCKKSVCFLANDKIILERKALPFASLIFAKVRWTILVSKAMMNAKSSLAPRDEGLVSGAVEECSFAEMAEPGAGIAGVAGPWKMEEKEAPLALGLSRFSLFAMMQILWELLFSFVNLCC